MLQPDENGKSVQTDLRQSLKPGKSEERKDSRQKPYPGGVSDCYGEELAYVTIPKDLSKVKNKVFLNLTKRQLICMGFAASIGVPFYFLTRGTLGTSNAAAGMVLLMLPEFFFALFEKNGMHLETILTNFINVRFKRPAVRRYEIENLYEYEPEKPVTPKVKKGGIIGKRKG